MSEESIFKPSFGEVLREASEGDRQAFESIYRALHRRVLAFARVRKHPDPEGLVNDVFLQVFRNLSKFDGTEPQSNAWVFKIARNKIIDDSRRRRRLPIELFGEVPGARTLQAADDVESQAIGNVQTESMLGYLDELTTEQRDVFILRFVSDLSMQTIARVLGKKIGAVKALQRRGLRSVVKKILADGRTPVGTSERSNR